MMVNHNQVENGNGNREAVPSSKCSYFVGSWLRQFLLANHHLVGKSFEMQNVCICIEVVSDFNQGFDDGSVAYRITDTDLSIRAIFTSSSLATACKGKDSSDDGIPPAMLLARSPIVLKECRLTHLTVPGAEHGDFALEVHNFDWENNKKISKGKVEDILYRAPQYIWCAEDPKLQEVIKKVSDKRGSGILSIPSVTNHLELLFKDLVGKESPNGPLSIQPEVAAAIGLFNFDEDNSGKKQKTQLQTENDCSKKTSVVEDVLGASESSRSSLSKFPLRKGNRPNVKPLNKSKSKCRNSVVPRTLLVSDSDCSKPYLQPNLSLTRLSPTDISNLKNVHSVNETSFFFDSMRSKKALPKWVPKVIKKPKFAKQLGKKLRGRPRNKSKTTAPTKITLPENFLFSGALQKLLSENLNNFPVSDTLLSPPIVDSAANETADNQVEPDVETDSQDVISDQDSESLAVDYEAELEDVSRKRLSNSTSSTSEEEHKKKEQNVNNSVYQDAFSKWLVSREDSGLKLAEASKLSTENRPAKEKNCDKVSNVKKSMILNLNLATFGFALIPKVVLEKLPPDFKLNENKRVNLRWKNISGMYLSHKDPVDIFSEKQKPSTPLESDSDSDIEIVYESPMLNTNSTHANQSHTGKNYTGLVGSTISNSSQKLSNLLTKTTEEQTSSDEKPSQIENASPLVFQVPINTLEPSENDGLEVGPLISLRGKDDLSETTEIPSSPIEKNMQPLSPSPSKPTSTETTANMNPSVVEEQVTLGVNEVLIEESVGPKMLEVEHTDQIELPSTSTPGITETTMSVLPIESMKQLTSSRNKILVEESLEPKLLEPPSTDQTELPSTSTSDVTEATMNVMPSESNKQVASSGNILVEEPLQTKLLEPESTDQTEVPSIPDNTETSVNGMPSESKKQAASSENIVVEEPLQQKLQELESTDRTSTPDITDTTVNVMPSESKKQVSSSGNKILVEEPLEPELLELESTDRTELSPSSSTLNITKISENVITSETEKYVAADGHKVLVEESQLPCSPSPKERSANANDNAEVISHVAITQRTESSSSLCLNKTTSERSETAFEDKNFPKSEESNLETSCPLSQCNSSKVTNKACEESLSPIVLTLDDSDSDEICEVANSPKANRESEVHKSNKRKLTLNQPALDDECHLSKKLCNPEGEDSDKAQQITEIVDLNSEDPGSEEVQITLAKVQLTTNSDAALTS